MSPLWVREVEQRLRRAGRHEIAATVKAHSHRFANVLNTEGQSFFYQR